MWILLIAFQFGSFAVVLDSEEECQAIGRLNGQYWAETQQAVTAVCARSWDV